MTNRQPSVNVDDKVAERVGAMDRENTDPEADEELARFMHGGEDAEGRRNVGGGDADELAVQGLLSLSQGNWR